MRGLETRSNVPTLALFGVAALLMLNEISFPAFAQSIVTPNPLGGPGPCPSMAAGEFAARREAERQRVMNNLAQVQRRAQQVIRNAQTNSSELAQQAQSAQMRLSRALVVKNGRETSAHAAGKEFRSVKAQALENATQDCHLIVAQENLVAAIEKEEALLCRILDVPSSGTKSRQELQDRTMKLSTPQKRELEINADYQQAAQETRLAVQHVENTRQKILLANAAYVKAKATLEREDSLLKEAKINHAKAAQEARNAMKLIIANHRMLNEAQRQFQNSQSQIALIRSLQ